MMEKVCGVVGTHYPFFEAENQYLIRSLLCQDNFMCENLDEVSVLFFKKIH